MELSIQISDNAYQRLVSTGCRIQGSIGLVSPTVGNFNEYVRHKDKEKERRYIRLRHGRISVDPQHVRLTLRISLDESGIIPAETLEDESREASDFVDDVLAMIERYH